MKSTALLLTAHELAGYDSPGKRLELVRGHLLIHEPAGFSHGDVMLRIGMAIADFARASSPPLGTVVVGDSGFWLQRNPDTVRAPDIAFVRRDRLPPEPIRGFAEFAPDLVVEVRSPSDRTGAMLAKTADWLSAGTALVWIVDPVRQSAQVYRVDGSVTVLGVADALDGEDVLPGFALPLSDVVPSPLCATAHAGR